MEVTCGGLGALPPGKIYILEAFKRDLPANTTMPHIQRIDTLIPSAQSTLEPM